MEADTMQIADADEAELDALAELWFRAWQDAHAGILPAELARERTLESFRERLGDAIADLRVAHVDGNPAGFSWIKDDELYQFYLAAEARGTGVARRLMDDAIAILRARGVHTAWLACAIGNDRAARFYEKAGWHNARVMTSHLPTPSGVFDLDVWRYEIVLSP